MESDTGPDRCQQRGDHPRNPQPHALDQHHDTASSPINDDAESPRPPASTDLGFEAVTPGIDPRAYSSKQAGSLSPQITTGQSYFSKADTSIPPRQREYNSLVRQATTTNAAAAMARPESLSDIQAANPDLSLSGNIISATFNAPHAFTYRKDGQWVSNFAHTYINTYLDVILTFERDRLSRF